MNGHIICHLNQATRMAIIYWPSWQKLFVDHKQAFTYHTGKYDRYEHTDHNHKYFNTEDSSIVHNCITNSSLKPEFIGYGKLNLILDGIRLWKKTVLQNSAECTRPV